MATKKKVRAVLVLMQRRRINTTDADEIDRLNFWIDLLTDAVKPKL